MTPSATQAPGRVLPASLGAVLVITFLNSIGTGLVNNGIYFLTDAGYGFSKGENLLFGVGLGVSYILGALAAGPGVRMVRRRLTRSSFRRIHAAVILLMAALCLIPPLLRIGNVPTGSTLAVVGIIGMALCYSPLSGILWPMVESYLSGGRRGERLRSSLGIWSVTWSSAVAVAYLMMAGVIKLAEATPDHPPLFRIEYAFLILAAIQLASLPAVLRLPPEPAPHQPEHHEPHPPVYTQLLIVFRILLPLAYVLTSALGPLLPNLVNRIGITKAIGPIVGSAWLFPRAISFLVYQKWHGWHGKWSMAIAGILLLIVGFAATVLAPLVPSQGLAQLTAVLGLVTFGIAMATIYVAAIYYAMEVGQAEVDAGGTHEALVGTGYAIGPLCGLAGVWAEKGAYVHQGAGDTVVVIIVSVASILVGAYAIRRALRIGARRREMP